MTPSSCEADVNGAITQLILQWISGEPAFGSDLVAFDIEANEATSCGIVAWRRYRWRIPMSSLRRLSIPTGRSRCCCNFP